MDIKCGPHSDPHRPVEPAVGGLSNGVLSLWNLDVAFACWMGLKGKKQTNIFTTHPGPY